jgi:hypothetical protein
MDKRVQIVMHSVAIFGSLSLSLLMDDDLLPSRLHHKIDGKKINFNCLYIGGISYVLQKLMKRKILLKFLQMDSNVK